MFQAVPPPIIRSTTLFVQLQVLSTSTAACCYEMERSSVSSTIAAVLVDNTWSCMYSYVLLMMGGGTAWNKYSVCTNKKIKKHCILLAVIWNYICDARTYECQKFKIGWDGTVFQLIHGSSKQQYWLKIPEAVYIVMCSWWWGEEQPETCRASVEINISRNVVSSWL